MKKLIPIFLLTIILLFIIVMPALADLPPDPGGGGPTGDPVGGGSPIGGGLFILAFSAMLYGFRKWKISR